MHIAILGATSQIAKDFIQSVEADIGCRFALFARQPDSVKSWLDACPILHSASVGAFGEFGKSAPAYDAIINFVGSGNPAKTERMGAGVLEVNHDFDSLALNYVKQHSDCRYIYFSSGAVYGGGFASPTDDQTGSVFPVNALGAQDWYGLAKLSSEARHRALADLPIVDLRVFNYFSDSVDVSARFLITDILRSIRDGEMLQTSDENIVRDYIGPQEITQLILKVLQAPPQNVAIDGFTQSPVDKITLLRCMQVEFGLQYEFVERRTGLLATGSKLNYYSRSRKAAQLFGYAPQATSMNVVLEHSRRILSRLQA